MARFDLVVEKLNAAGERCSILYRFGDGVGKDSPRMRRYGAS
jgi:hypothetical protein